MFVIIDACLEYLYQRKNGFKSSNYKALKDVIDGIRF